MYFKNCFGDGVKENKFMSLCISFSFVVYFDDIIGKVCCVDRTDVANGRPAVRRMGNSETLWSGRVLCSALR